MADDDGYLALILVFTTISLMAFGGVNAILPEMHRQVVDVHHWTTDAGFTELFAVAQAAPGPNLMVITLIGWQVGGFTGALIATLAGVTPSCLLAYGVSSFWMRHREKRWRNALKVGMIPVTVGLIAAGAFVIVSAVSGGNWRLIAVSAVTAGLVFLTRIHPLIPLAVAGALGYAGLF